MRWLVRLFAIRSNSPNSRPNSPNSRPSCPAPYAALRFRIATTAVLFSANFASLPPLARATETVSVVVTSGRTFHGEVDVRTIKPVEAPPKRARSNSRSSQPSMKPLHSPQPLPEADTNPEPLPAPQPLWLVVRGPGYAVRRPIDWNRVREVRAGDATYSAAEFRNAIVSGEIELADEKNAPTSAPLANTSTSPDPNSAATAQDQPGDKDTANQTPGDDARTRRPVELAPIPAGAASYEEPPPPITSLAIEASIANWDADPEIDGILLRVFPIDAYGNVQLVDGTLDVMLVATFSGFYPVRHRIGAGPTHDGVIGRWVRHVEPLDFSPRGAPYRLDYQAFHPEFDADFGPYGQVHAKLAVPGQGVFEATTSLTRLRTYSPIRDWRQQRGEHRFLNFERTGRPIYSSRSSH